MKIPISYVVGAIGLYLLVTGKAQDLLGIGTAQASTTGGRQAGQPGWGNAGDQPPTANGPDIGGVVKSVADFGGKLLDWFNAPKTSGSSNGATTSSPSASVPFFLAENSDSGFSDGGGFWK